MCDFSQYGGASQEWLRVQEQQQQEAALSRRSDVLDLDQLKKSTNNGREMVARQEMVELKGKVVMRDHMLQTRDGHSLEARSYRPIETSHALPIYMHLHGGGMLFGTLSSEDAICTRIALGAQEVVVFNVNYRHTPEYTYPTAWDDAEDAFNWLLEHSATIGGDKNRIIVGGISAGGQLGAALVLKQHRATSPSNRSIVGQVLMVPCLVHVDCYGPQLDKLKDGTLSSYRENENAPILPLTRIKMFNKLQNVTDPDVNDLRLNPGNAHPSQVSGMPPTVLGVAGLDPLRDEALLYGKMLAENSVPTKTILFKGVPHGFRRFGTQLNACRRWDESITDGIHWILSAPTASGRFEVTLA